MNNFFWDLEEIAKTMNIIQDPSEEKEQWARRVVYSICARMALASLWDSESDGTVSVQHMKNRILEILEVYQLLLPEIISSDNYGDFNKSIAEDIYSTYLASGFLYHKANRVTSSLYSTINFDNICLVKGIYATSTCYMSGMGPYIVNDLANEKGFDLHINHPNAGVLLNKMIDDAVWDEYYGEVGKESFLRTYPSFKNKYWIDKYDRPGEISLFKYGEIGKEALRYCLCKKVNGELFISELPYWMSEDRRFTLLSVELLKRFGTLPQIIAKKQESFVEIDVGYRLPPEEEALFRLYSWPKRFDMDNQPFNRIVSNRVYPIMKELFVQTGFEVKEEN